MSKLYAVPAAPFDGLQVTLPAGTLAWADDYQESVKILSVEKKARGYISARYKIRRANGETVSNYPGYFLVTR